MARDLTMVVADRIQENDVLLHPFLNSADEVSSDRVLSELISIHAQPAIKDIVSYRLRSFLSVADMQDIEDVHSTAIAQLLSHLTRLKNNPSERFISNFRSYVAVVAYNACHEYLRRKYPQRSKLKNRLRYLFSHHPDFAIWENADKEMTCGLAAWRGRENDSGALVRLRRFEEGESDQQGLSRSQLRRLDISDGLSLLFKWLEGPVELDTLLGVVAEIWEIKDQTVSFDATDDSQDAVDALQDERVDIAADVERKLFLQRLWTEIRELPVRQRLALLLNLRDPQGHDLISLLPITGIASVSQIAEVLEIPAEKFAELWNELPLEDAQIADKMGLTRQQVINLRKSARERLSRRLKGGEQKKGK